MLFRSPIAWVILPTYVIAFPVMSPMGLVKYANYSNMIGMLIQIFGLVIFKLFGYLNLYTICALASLAEVSVFIYRIIIVLINRRKINI